MFLIRRGCRGLAPGAPYCDAARKTCGAGCVVPKAFRADPACSKTNPRALVCKTCTHAERHGTTLGRDFPLYTYIIFFYLPAVDRPECQLRRIDYKLAAKRRHLPLRGRRSTQVEIFFFSSSSVVIVTVVICGVHTLSKALDSLLFFWLRSGRDGTRSVVGVQVSKGECEREEAEEEEAE